MNINIRKLHPDAIIPQIAHESDAGVDLYALEDYELKAGERKLFPSGFAIAIPQGYVGLIWPRSGLSYKKGIDVLAGVIDAGYRGDVGMVLLNTGSISCFIKKGDRIAQLLIQPIVLPKFKQVDFLEESQRGSGGFGSSGK